MNKADIEAFVDNLDLTLLTLTVICSQIIFKLFSDVGSIVDTLVGGGSVGKVGKETGAVVENAARDIAKEPLKAVGGFAKAVKDEGKEKLKDSEAGRLVITAKDKVSHFTKEKLLGLK